jgi:hypothetical protein
MPGEEKHKKKQKQKQKPMTTDKMSTCSKYKLRAEALNQVRNHCCIHPDLTESSWIIFGTKSPPKYSRKPVKVQNQCRGPEPVTRSDLGRHFTMF